MPRVCILTQYYLPEMGAPQTRLHELALRLQKRGWGVDVLTALPNYPAGAIFPGYPKLRRRFETVDDVALVRLPLYPSNARFLGRLTCYLSFVASACLFGKASVRRPDVIYVESTPIFIGLAARWLARRWNAPFVLNVSDLWPESPVRMGVLRDGLAVRLAERFELSLYRRAAAVTGQSSETIASIEQRTDGVRTEVLTNGVDPQRFSNQLVDDEARRLIGEEEGPVFIYGGLLGYAQGLDQVLDLAATVPETVPGRFVLFGDGPERERLEHRIEREGLRRVRLLEPQPRERVPALLAAADAAIVTLGFELPGTVPAKIYEAMAARLPILLAAGGEGARRVREAGCGLVVEPGEKNGLLAAFERLAVDPALRRELGAKGRLAAETVYNRDRIADSLESLLREVVEE